MIRQIRGTLLVVERDSTTALIDPGFGVSLGVSLTARGAIALAGSVGGPIELATYLYLETSNQGATFTPRLAGFISPHEAGLFDLLTTVKGIGPRKALRVIALPSEDIATAITMGDTKTLCALPEIGRRTAEGVVLALKDRIAELAALSRRPLTGSSGGESVARSTGNTAEATLSRNEESAGENTAPQERGGLADAMHEAVEVLVNLGEPRLEAIQKVRGIIDAMARSDRDAGLHGVSHFTTEQIVQRVFQRGVPAAASVQSES